MINTTNRTLEWIQLKVDVHCEEGDDLSISLYLGHFSIS